MNIFLEINKNISSNLNNFVLNYNLENYNLILSDSPIFFLPIFLLWSWLFYSYKIKDNSKKSDLLNIFFSILIAIIISLIIQQLVHIDRPETIIEPLLKHIPDASFPSDHATVSFAFLTWLFLASYKKTFYIFSIFVITMNLSRIAWGIHWFFDIIVWALIWILSSIYIFKYFKNTKIGENINKFIIKILNIIKL
jgi:undecaprenyl-diphosphatase